MTTPAWLDLEGVDNMRDVGGLPLDGGGHTRAGRLIRSDNLQELPPASVRHLVDHLHVTDIVDLRTVVEVAKEGDGPLVSEPGIAIHHLTLYDEDTAETGIPAGERPLPWVRDPNLGDPNLGDRAPARPTDHDTYWSGHYLGYLAKRPDSVVAALRAIADADGAVVVHCAAGKDRTGTVVGLALLLVGVTQDAVVDDFAASAERVPRLLEKLARRPAYAANLAGRTAEQQAPRPDTMRRLIAALDAEGGVQAWLSRQGWTDADTERLRAKLVGSE